jgi:hypothetical protein
LHTRSCALEQSKRFFQRRPSSDVCHDSGLSRAATVYQTSRPLSPLLHVYTALAPPHSITHSTIRICLSPCSCSPLKIDVDLLPLSADAACSFSVFGLGKLPSSVQLPLSSCTVLGFGIWSASEMAWFLACMRFLAMDTESRCMKRSGEMPPLLWMRERASVTESRWPRK